jgi:hypothetical protein
MPIASITVDLDALPHYHAIHGLPAPAPAGADPVYEVGVVRLLDLFEQEGVRGTLFVVGQDTHAPAHSALLKHAHAAGHELGNHSYSHRYDLRMLSHAEQDEDIARGEDAIEAVCGVRPVGFRTPGYNVSETILELLTRRGVLYDSSVFPCLPYYVAKGLVMACRAAMGQPSRSAMTQPETLLAPITPYRPERGRFWRHDPKSKRPWEIPMALIPGVRLPVIGTSLHLLREAGFDAAWPLLRRAYPTLFQLEMHAIDFMDADDPGCGELAAHQPDLRVPWAVKRARYQHVFGRLRESYTFAPLRDWAMARSR